MEFKPTAIGPFFMARPLPESIVKNRQWRNDVGMPGRGRDGDFDADSHVAIADREQSVTQVGRFHFAEAA
ncbi:hypothetical protein L2Y90_28835 [Burkholderia pyrrocinia]|uniref:hypothetical protein n=1 Tax=Burkholderia pyrrocinia TaxID=60550 RepID=UPI00215AB5DD|nr:hypothetical protein [Burkholderia pyrrocinia]UVE68113.1 hypothetical protein L2Y90_28835 [Burkholderia pyrrocinia]